ncbi:MAG: aminoacyl-histidine dipeptidase [Lachnospiraceae bacterium]|jgi:dipeptidase D|nr:aminoacyl-histidine dipeptidase [Lachnospiraceae bacterium]
MGVSEALEPKKVFRFFEEICHIPHGSGNVDKLSDYLVSFAKDRGLYCRQDEMKNVIISKEASPGYENAEGIILQGHMDMVAVKKPGCDIDMKTQGLKPRVEGDYIYAENTSLGGDDGIAVAYALAILDDNSLPHPHLDVVITVDEEVGMDGAKALDLSDVKGSRLLNLDSEEEGYFLAGCAGGASVKHILETEWENRTGTAYTCKICGLLGGHSGGEIHKERGNANSLMGRFLQELSAVTQIGICWLEGGLADNAIPREAVLKFVVSEKESELEQAVRAFEKVLQAEFSTKDPGVKIEMAKQESVSCPCLRTDCAEKVKNLLFLMPNGVQAMSADMHGLVQTSLNNGIMKLGEKEFTVVTSVRSSVDSEKRTLLTKIKTLTEVLGGTVEVTGDYPGWTYRKKSPFRDLCVKVYEEMYGKKPVIQAIHAGVECGILLQKRPDLDCISLGPDMKDIHTTEEKLSISSTKRVWEYVCRVLAQK